MFLFQCTNNYASIFYVAFFKVSGAVLGWDKGKADGSRRSRRPALELTYMLMQPHAMAGPCGRQAGRGAEAVWLHAGPVSRIRLSAGGPATDGEGRLLFSSCSSFPQFFFFLSHRCFPSQVCILLAVIMVGRQSFSHFQELLLPWFYAKLNMRSADFVKQEPAKVRAGCVAMRGACWRRVPPF